MRRARFHALSSCGDAEPERRERFVVESVREEGV
jgi:hypothetical protein